MAWFTNNGAYHTLVMCLQSDWFWIGAYVTTAAAIIIAYAEIGRQAWLAKGSNNNSLTRTLMGLSLVFVFCALSGYVMPIVRIWWPAYRLEVILQFFLAIVAWFFVISAYRTHFFERIFNAASGLPEHETQMHLEDLGKLILPIGALLLFGAILHESSQAPVVLERRNPAFSYTQANIIDGIPHYTPISGDLYPDGYCPDDVVDYEVHWLAERAAQLEGEISFHVESDGQTIVAHRLQYFPFIHISQGDSGAAYYNWELPDLERSLPPDARAYIRGVFWNNAEGYSVYRVSVPLSATCWH